MEQKRTASYSGRTPLRCGRWLLCLGVFFALLQTAFSAIIAIDINLEWLSGTMPRDGAIIQVIAYNSSMYPQGIPTEVENQFQAVHNHDDNQYYDPTTIPEGTFMIATSEVIGGGTDEYGSWPTMAYLAFALDSELYDSLYIRVFDATEFPECPDGMELTWGLTDLGVVGAIAQGINYEHYWTNVPLDRQNYFEVIPEPSTLALFGVGVTTLCAAGRRRRKRCSTKTKGGFFRYQKRIKR